MAAATDKIVYWTTVQIGLGVSGTILLLWTLWETRRATNLASDTAQRELRAYVFVHKNQITNFAVGQNPVIRIVAKNTGQTPAYKVIFHSEMIFGPNLVDANQFPPIKPLASHASSAAVPAGGEATSTMVNSEPLTQEEMSGITQGHAALYASGYIRYVDTFGTEQTTNFRLMFTKQSIDTGSTSLAMCSSGNDAT